MTNPSKNFERSTKKDALNRIGVFKFDFFEVATNGTIKSLIKELKDYQKKINKNELKISQIEEGNIKENEWKVIDKVGEYALKIEFLKDLLNSLLEMRIVYLFKNLEIVMKSMIQTAYPNSNTKDIYKWENMKSFFLSKEIDISIIDGYIDSVDTRKVNNSIKHNESMGEDIKNIKEFKGAVELNNENLERFYWRVKPKIEIFCEKLKLKIVDELYSFNNDRLNKIANEYYERMDIENLKLLINKLKIKLDKSQ